MHPCLTMAVGLMMLTAGGDSERKSIVTATNSSLVRWSQPQISSTARRSNPVVRRVAPQRGATSKPAVGTGVRKTITGKSLTSQKNRVSPASYDGVYGFSEPMPNVVHESHAPTTVESVDLPAAPACGCSTCKRRFSRLPLGHKLTGCGWWLHKHKPDLTPHIPYRAMPADYYYFRPYHYQHIPFHQGEVVQYGLDPRNPYDNSLFDDLYEGLEEDEDESAEEIMPGDDPPAAPVETPTPADPASHRGRLRIAPPVRPALPTPLPGSLQSRGSSDEPSGVDQPSELRLRSSEVSFNLPSQPSNPLRTGFGR